MEILYTFESVKVLWQAVLFIVTSGLLLTGGMLIGKKSNSICNITIVFFILTLITWFTVPFMDGFRTTYYQVKVDSEQDIDTMKYKVSERRGTTFVIERR